MHHSLKFRPGDEIRTMRTFFARLRKDKVFFVKGAQVSSWTLWTYPLCDIAGWIRDHKLHKAIETRTRYKGGDKA